MTSAPAANPRLPLMSEIKDMYLRAYYGKRIREVICMKALKEREHKVIYKDGDKVVKVFDETFSKADVLNEALNMARVEETGLRIPKLLNVSKVDGKWAITREYIEGTPLSQLMAQHPEKQDEYLNTFVDIQLEILGKTCPHLNKIKDKMHAKISASDYEATLRYDLHNRLEG